MSTLAITCRTYFSLSLLSYSLYDQVEFDENYFDRLSIQLRQVLPQITHAGSKTTSTSSEVISNHHLKCSPLIIRTIFSFHLYANLRYILQFLVAFEICPQIGRNPIIVISCRILRGLISTHPHSRQGLR